MNGQIHFEEIWVDVQKIKRLSPLVHNITNYVAMEQTANGLLALGASPVMAHALEEVEEMAKSANALVLNIGTLSPHWVEAMQRALKAALLKGIPVILDPVGAGATKFRTQTTLELLKAGSPTVIRGNAAEIMALYDHQRLTKGVESNLNPLEYEMEANKLAQKYQTTVWMSGSTDLITDGQQVFLVHNGHPLIKKVTGMGCVSTALTAAFCAVNLNSLLGAVHTALIWGIASELAAKKAEGPGTFKTAIIDALYHMTKKQIQERMKVEAR